MIKRWRSGWLFPLVLAVGLGGLSAWLDRISEVDVEEVVLNPNEPQYSMSGIDGRRFDEAGRLKENLSAEHAWQLPKRDDVHFSRPDLALYRDGHQLYRVQSEDARYDIESRKVFFEKDVLLVKAAEAGRPEGVLKTSGLTVDTQNENAYTDAEVAYQYGRSSGTAKGMQYNHNQGFLNLPSRVKAIIYDPKNP